ncbi:MAG: phosphodiester glycosidase family protein [Bacteroides sp.]|nr:phosphodiester glycosidase family protein [Prevotella sp.]MCM1407595.1 phosphodiester glycosidase family protein [Treponema brennaborense]MCM1469255.1 phosphodiester glycosidase family protein [Bacteroides sp.]
MYLSGCASAKTAGNFAQAELQYDAHRMARTIKKQIHRAVLYERLERSNPPLVYHLVTVALDDAAVRITAEPSGQYGEKTEKFAERTNSTVAVNAAPWKRKGLLKREPAGLIINAGILCSPPIHRYAALAFDAAKKARVFSSQAELSGSSYTTAVGGFFQILKNGEHFGSFIKTDNSRTAAGVSKNGCTLYLLVVEGEQKRHSAGLDFAACADILKEAGAYDAIQLDGGASSSLFINKTNMLSYNGHKKNVSSLGIIIE